ncbi:hypothetical protein MN116_000823 [Schistosoma mekongi]|uniref:C2 domain-containing protein n=1 Tax=Schistosoma mekongi TaxID=38744 RepID=A0AAE1ZKV5_SCHME|nr:hypothetical protein MN116_000823 [Schistosoma mekongi]
MKKTFQPIINILSTKLKQNTYSSSSLWVPFTKSSNAIGHIHFSLEYTSTLKTLNVVISHLTGVSTFGKTSTSQMSHPSQIKATFIVVLQLRKIEIVRYNSGECYVESDALHKRRFTAPVQTSSNPYFDQSFVFPIPTNYLKHCELVFSIFHTSSTEHTIEFIDTAESSNCNESVSHSTNYDMHQLHHHYKWKSLEFQKYLDAMQCIGEAIYKIDLNKLIQYPKQFSHIWQEFYPPTNSDEKSALNKNEMNLDSEEKKRPVTENQEEKYIPKQETMVLGLSKQPMMEFSIMFTKQWSSFNMHVKRIRNLKVQTNEKLIFCATYYLNNIILQSLTSESIKINELQNKQYTINNKIQNNNHILDDIQIPYNKQLTLTIEINELINYQQNIQIIFELFIQTIINNEKECLGKIVLCSKNYNNVNNHHSEDDEDELPTLQYNELIQELYKLKKYNSLDSTRRITYWHPIDRL